MNVRARARARVCVCVCLGGGIMDRGENLGQIGRYEMHFFGGILTVSGNFF